MKQAVVVIGQGYVGLPLALRAVEVGHAVHGLDQNSDIIASLGKAHSHIDDVTDNQLADALAKGYVATTDPRVLTEADVVIVCVPTPLSPDGGPDLTAIVSAAHTIHNYISPDTTVILESTTYPGTTDEIFRPIVLGERFKLDDEVRIAFSPERVDPGNKKFGIKNTPKVVGGISDLSTSASVAFYSTIVDTVVPAKGAREAELTKLIENTFRHVNIALANEMVRFSNDLGIDLWDAITCASSKPFGYMPFWPGPGVGGHCIPVDPSYLSHQVKAKLGYAFRMVELAEEINLAAPRYVASRIQRMLNDQAKAINGARVLLVGITYKSDIADMRESPAMPLFSELRSWGADVSYYDPYVDSWSVGGKLLYSVSDLYTAASSVDIVVLLQAHGQVDVGRLVGSAPALLDTRGVVETQSEAVRRL